MWRRGSGSLLLAYSVLRINERTKKIKNKKYISQYLVGRMAGPCRIVGVSYLGIGSVFGNGIILKTTPISSCRPIYLPLKVCPS